MASKEVTDLTAITAAHGSDTIAVRQSGDSEDKRATLEQVQAKIGVWNLSADTTLHISPSGNDTTGDGSSGAPFATPQRAATLFSSCIANGFTATIQLANGTYNYSTTISETLDGQRVTVMGDVSNPSNVVISVPSGERGFYLNGGLLAVYGVHIQAASGNVIGFGSLKPSSLNVGNLSFGDMGSGGDCFNLGSAAVLVNQTDPISLNGNMAHFINIYDKSKYDQRAAITKDTNFTVSSATVNVVQGGTYRHLGGASWGGSATVTGKRYNAALGGNLLYDNANNIFGNAAGTGTNPNASPYGYVGGAL